jgi:hypothetical protein
VGSKDWGERITIDREFSSDPIIAIFFDQTQVNEGLMTAGIAGAQRAQNRASGRLIAAMRLAQRSSISTLRASHGRREFISRRGVR